MEEDMGVAPHQLSTTGGLGFSQGCERAPWGALDTALSQSLSRQVHPTTGGCQDFISACLQACVHRSYSHQLNPVHRKE